MTLTILAGGAGSRMRRPKAHLLINGCPILRYLLQRFAWPGPTLLVTAPGRQNPPAYSDFDREVVDPVAGIGPLRGILTALENAVTERVVVATVDMPGISREQLRWLISKLDYDPKPLGIMIRRTSDAGGRVEPFPLIIRRMAREVVVNRLATNDRSVHGLATLPELLVKPAPQTWDEKTWLNLNFPADVTEFNRHVDH